MDLKTGGKRYRKTAGMEKAARKSRESRHICSTWEVSKAASRTGSSEGEGAGVSTPSLSFQESGILDIWLLSQRVLGKQELDPQELLFRSLFVPRHDGCLGFRLFKLLELELGDVAHFEVPF